MSRIDAIHFTDPGCPWAYSATPALTALRWRYGDQLNWRHVMIGLAENGDRYDANGYTADRMAIGQRKFRRFGMPLSAIPKQSLTGTTRACRAIIAVRLADPSREWWALRQLQKLQFQSGADFEDDAALIAAVGAEAAGRIEDAEVWEAYEADKAETRTAEGGPAEAQQKTATSDGPVRYTAPSVIFSTGEQQLVAGGFQSYAAYDVILANLDPTLDRRDAPDDVSTILREFPDGLYVAEVAEIYATTDSYEVDRGAAEDALIALQASGGALRDGELWLSAD